MARPRPPGIHVWDVVGKKPRIGRGLCPRCGRPKEESKSGEKSKSGWCNQCKKEWAESHRESRRRSQSRYARSDGGLRCRREYKIRERGLMGTPIRTSDKDIRPELAKFRKGEISLTEFRQFLRDYPYEESRRILRQLRLNQRRF
jgi:hypothetical protein